MQIPVFEKQIAVGPEAIDELGHVNNLVYLRWMTDAACEHSAALGWTMERYAREKRAFVVASHHIDYLRPCFAGDRLVLYTWVEAMSGVRSVRRYGIKRDGRLVACGMTEWAFVDMSGARPRAVPVPSDVASCFTPVSGDDPAIAGLGLARVLRC